MSNSPEVISVSSDEDDGIPDCETCQKLTEEFAKITGTDQACAQFFLQDRKWDLQKSVNDYFECTDQSHSKTSKAPVASPKVNECMLKAYGLGQPTSVPPSRLSLISWNLDGLDTRNLKMRTKAASKIIFEEKPDIVFFQELIPETFKYIQELLPEYMCIQGNNIEYFTAILLRKFTVYYDSHEIIPYPGTHMLRNLMNVKAHIGSVKLNLFNSHMESGVESADERKKQLKILFEAVRKVPKEESVLFGGDLNMRDSELLSIGGLPPGIDDLWVFCGSRKECQYTWDTERNTNKEFPGKFKPRCRFDRIFIRHNSPCTVVPKHFGLVGIQKVANAQCYPSDHWAIQIFFETMQVVKENPSLSSQT